MQDIQAFGGWNLNQMQLHYLLTGLKPLTMMIAGGWPVGNPHNLDQYWRPNMMVLPPAELIYLLMPWLATLEQRVKDADKAGQSVKTSARGLLQLLPYLATVVIQDALELCSPPYREAYRKNPVHRLLMQSETFR